MHLLKKAPLAFLTILLFLNSPTLGSQENEHKTVLILYSLGHSDDANVNTLIFQYFINYNLKNGWYLTSTPIITANWREDSDARWTVPVGLGVGRLVKFGKQPVDFKIQPFWYVEKPVNGPDWSLQLQVKLLFPK